MARSQITSGSIADNSISSGDFASGAVTANSILDGDITHSKLSSSLDLSSKSIVMPTIDRLSITGGKQTLTTVASADEGTQTCHLPYGGSNQTVIFYNSGGYSRLVGRCYWHLNISQVHSGYFDFHISRYGINTYNVVNSGYVNLVSAMGINGNVDHNGIVWNNNNTNTWGDGSLTFHVEAWGNGSLESGRYSDSPGNYDTSNTTKFARKMVK